MDFAQALKNENISFAVDVSCKTLSTFKIGGIADFLIEPADKEQLKTALFLADRMCVRYKVIGCGSNLLFSDKGYRGALIRIKPPFSGCELIDHETVRVYAGERLSRLCTFAAQHSLSGLEFAFGIPGSLGGAVYMNAGAYGGEMSDVLVGAEVLTVERQFEYRTTNQLELSYRHSALCDNNELLIYADLKLKQGNMVEIEKRMSELIAARNEKQPLNLPSAGSTFKRPIGGYASALIDECGLKGFAVGGAAVSKKHAGFVVNVGDATCIDVLTLCDEIKRIVLEKKGINLELEVAAIPEQ